MPGSMHRQASDDELIAAGIPIATPQGDDHQGEHSKAGSKYILLSQTKLHFIG